MFGAVECELPVCVRSWWNIGHQSVVDCVPENLDTLLESAAPKETLFEKNETKNNITKAKQTIALLFIPFSPFFNAWLKVLAPKVVPMANYNYSTNRHGSTIQ